MTMLKDVKSFKGFTNSLLANSPLWNKPVDQIIPAQLVAFRERLKLEGHQDTVSLFKTIVDSLNQAKASGEITNAPILDFAKPKAVVMDLRRMREAFERMSRPTPSAILFALEVGLDPDELTVLTWERAKALAKAGRVKTYARSILEGQPRHISCKYVFWRQGPKGGAHALYGLELEVFEEFGMVWSELVQAYKDMVPIGTK